MIVLPSIERPNYKFDRIAFVGPMCSGKTFLAKAVLSGIQGYTLISFATELKLITTRYFDVTGKDGHARHRYQQVGTALRKIDKNVWINPVLEQVAADPHHRWIIDDVRYRNEAEELTKAGFYLFRAYTPEDIRQTRIRTLYPSTKPSASKHPSEKESREIVTDENVPSYDSHDGSRLVSRILDDLYECYSR